MTFCTMSTWFLDHISLRYFTLCFVFKFLIGMHLDTHPIVANVEWHILSFFMKCASTPKVVESFNIHVQKLE